MISIQNVGDSRRKLERAFKAVKEQFEIDSLLSEQEFLLGCNIFLNLPTDL